MKNEEVTSNEVNMPELKALLLRSDCKLETDTRSGGYDRWYQEDTLALKEIASCPQ